MECVSFVRKNAKNPSKFLLLWVKRQVFMYIHDSTVGVHSIQKCRGLLYFSLIGLDLVCTSPPNIEHIVCPRV